MRGLNESIVEAVPVVYPAEKCPFLWRSGVWTSSAWFCVLARISLDPPARNRPSRFAAGKVTVGLASQFGGLFTDGLTAKEEIFI